MVCGDMLDPRERLMLEPQERAVIVQLAQGPSRDVLERQIGQDPVAPAWVQAQLGGVEDPPICHGGMDAAPRDDPFTRLERGLDEGISLGQPPLSSFHRAPSEPPPLCT